MNQIRAKNRRWAFFLIFTAVLFLGLVQWSFLPLLIDSGMSSSNAVLVVSAGHTSKFAAPFKCLFGDFHSPCLLQSATPVPAMTASFFRRVEESIFSSGDRFSSHRQLRAPPSA